MGYNQRNLKYTDDQVLNIREDYMSIKLIRNQMRRIKREVSLRELKLSDLRMEIQELKTELMDKHSVSYSTLWSIGEGLSRRHVK